MSSGIIISYKKCSSCSLRYGVYFHVMYELQNETRILAQLIMTPLGFLNIINKNKKGHASTISGSFHGPLLDLKQPPSLGHLHKPPKNSGS